MYLLIYTSIQDKLQFCMLCLKHVSDMFVAAKRFQVSGSLMHVYSVYDLQRTPSFIPAEISLLIKAKVNL